MRDMYTLPCRLFTRLCRKKARRSTFMMIKPWEKYRKTHKPGSFTPSEVQRSWRDGCGSALGNNPESETRRMKRVEIEDARLASSITETLWEAMFRPARLLFMNMRLTRSWMCKISEQFQKQIPRLISGIWKQNREQIRISVLEI